MKNEEILFKEYQTLREEIIASMSNRNQILSYGLAIIGLLFTSAAALNKTELSFIILILAIPIVCILYQ